MIHKILPVLVFPILLLGSAPIRAHHSPSAVFDMGNRVKLTGTLTKVDWFNPHIAVFLDAKKADGTVENWKLESNPPSWFRRVGLGRDDIAKGLGQTVTIEGVRAKNGGPYGYLLKITFQDGNSLELEFKPTPNGE